MTQHHIIASKATLRRYLGNTGVAISIGTALGRAIEGTGELENVRQAERRAHNERVRKALLKTRPGR